MKIVVICLLLILGGLQFKLWIEGHGISELVRLKSEQNSLVQINQRLSERNQALQAQVHNLKNGYDVLEEHARNDLGMVKSDEVYYQVLAQ